VSDGDPARVLDVEGPAAPPRRNGELVFGAPWESRVFGLTLALVERGAFAWEEFRALLIDEIARWERETVQGTRDAGEWSYYARWQAALERLLARKGLCAPAELEVRAAAFEARPHGHDH
jgi:nitrile hydratase accessory protein